MEKQQLLELISNSGSDFGDSQDINLKGSMIRRELHIDVQSLQLKRTDSGYKSAQQYSIQIKAAIVDLLTMGYTDVQVKNYFKEKEQTLKYQPNQKHDEIVVNAVHYFINNQVELQIGNEDNLLSMMGNNLIRQISKKKSKDSPKFQQIELERQKSQYLVQKPSVSLVQRQIECQCCFELENENEFIQCIDECEHKFCKNCIFLYLSNKIMASEIDKIKCPSQDCDKVIKEEVLVTRLLDKNLLSKYRQYKLNQEVSQSKNKFFCPSAVCNGEFVLQQIPDLKCVTCISCKKQFCFNCKQQHEEAISCQDFLLQKENQVKDNQIEEFKKMSIKQCPSCQILIQKNSGCNKMHCDKCEASFCWLCLSILDPENPYDHFNNEGQNNHCMGRLWDGYNMNDDFYQIRNGEGTLILIMIAMSWIIYLACFDAISMGGLFCWVDFYYGNLYINGTLLLIFNLFYRILRQNYEIHNIFKKALCNLMFIMYMTKVFYLIAFMLRATWFIFLVLPYDIINAGFSISFQFGLIILFLFILTVILTFGPDKPLSVKILRCVLQFLFGGIMLLNIFFICLEFFNVFWPTILLYIIVQCIVDCINRRMIRRNGEF